MKEKLKRLATSLMGFYYIVTAIAVPYMTYREIKENSFVWAIFAAPFVGPLKGMAWPYFLVYKNIETVPYNRSYVSFVAAIRSFAEAGEVMKKHDSSTITDEDRSKLVAMFDKTLLQLSGCDRKEMEIIYPGWGMQMQSMTELVTATKLAVSGDQEAQKNWSSLEGKVKELDGWLSENLPRLDAELPRRIKEKQASGLL